MNTAARLFYNQGYNLTGINQIIEEADIAKTTLYVYYKSKTDLLNAYLDESSVVFFDGLTAFIKNKKSPKAKILAIFQYHINLYKVADYVGCAFLKIKSEVSSDDREVWLKVQANKSKLKDIINKLVSEHELQQTFSDDTLCNMIYYMLEGATVTASVTKTDHDIKKSMEIIDQLI